MALPLPPGLTPSEVGFLCEMELVTVVPRHRLEGLELLGVSVPWQWQRKTVICFKLYVHPTNEYPRVQRKH